MDYLTPEIIADFPPNDQLNALIAEHCAGWKELVRDERSGRFLGINPESNTLSWVPLYCSTFDALFLPSSLIELFNTAGELRFDRQTKKYVYSIGETAASADTQPLALCRAALLAVYRDRESKADALS